MSNRLANESSLYLRQHAENPVDWHPWGDEALAKAKAESKPIFLSIGYSACHWCHVMEHESFEDAATAAVMNEHFVCIKVDREERPDLDQIYMTSLQLLTREGGGWPLSVWLTPHLTPFYAGTYFPPTDKYGRPSFRRVLLAVAESWQSKREQLESVGSQVAEALQESMALSSKEGELSEATLLAALEALKRNYDPKYGGFGHAPKFPHAVDLRLLLRLGHRFKDQTAIDMVTHTLTMMARGGIYDQIGGGFARYSVDEKWLVPHFEKMLYDNALLVPVYLEAWQITGDEFLLSIARRTLAYIEREMTSKSEPAYSHFKTRFTSGAFFSSEDADSEGVEGKYYVWTEAEFDELLGRDAEVAKRYFGVSAQGNWEGHNILTCVSDQDADKMEGCDRIFEIQQKLLKARAKRIRPGRDEKILTAWNGLAISAFAQAQRAVMDGGNATAAARFILENLRTPDGHLLRTCGDDQPAKIAAYLEDYAYFIEGLIELHQATQESEWLEHACSLADIMIADYFDESGEGFYFTLKGQGDLIARTKDWHDGSTPSGNAVAVTALLKLAILCDRPDYRMVAERTLHAFSGLLNENPAAAAQMLIALDFHIGPVREVAIVASWHLNEADDDSFSEYEQLRDVITKTFQPRQLLAMHSTRQGDPPEIVALFRDKQLPYQESDVEDDDSRNPSEEITTYVCHNYQCDAPVVGLEAAIKALGANS